MHLPFGGAHLQMHPVTLLTPVPKLAPDEQSYSPQCELGTPILCQGGVRQCGDRLPVSEPPWVLPQRVSSQAPLLVCGLGKVLSE